MKYITDEQGKWEDYGSHKLLVEASEGYIQQLKLEEQQRIENELLNKQPTVDDYLLDYEFRLSMLELGL